MKRAGERGVQSVETDVLRQPISRRLGEFALKAGLSVRNNLALGLASAGLAALPAGVWGITHATTEDMIGANQADFATTIGDRINLDLGPAGNAYLRDPVAPLSMNVTVKGIPIEEGKSLLSPALLEEYRETYDNLGPYLGHVERNLINDAIWKGLAAEAVAGSALFGAIKNRKKLSKAVKPAIIGLTAAGVVMAPFAYDHIKAKAQAPPEITYTIPQLDGTPLAGTEVTSLALQDLFKTILPEWLKLQKQEITDRKAYIASSEEQLIAAKDKIGQRAPGEMVAMVYSDMHSSKVMTQILPTLNAIVEPELTINAGDESNEATTTQNAAMKDQVDIMQDHKDNIFIVGNHDTDKTGEAIAKAGGTWLDGKTTTVDNLKVLGYSDPVVNYQNSSVRYQRSSKGPQTEEELGQVAYEKAEEVNPDILVVHEPDVVSAFIKSAGTKSIPVKLIINGHMHIADGPYIIPNSDGTYTVKYQSGTTGGKKALSASSYWTPESTPGTNASAALFFIDSTTHEPVAYQTVTFTPDGQVIIGEKTYFKVPHESIDPTASVPNDQAGENVATRQGK